MSVTLDGRGVRLSNLAGGDDDVLVGRPGASGRAASGLAVAEKRRTG